MKPQGHTLALTLSSSFRDPLHSATVSALLSANTVCERQLWPWCVRVPYTWSSKLSLPWPHGLHREAWWLPRLQRSPTLPADGLLVLFVWLSWCKIFLLEDASWDRWSYQSLSNTTCLFSLSPHPAAAAYVASPPPWGLKSSGSFWPFNPDFN